MAHYEPLDAIIDVPTVQEARSGEFHQKKRVELPVCFVHVVDPHST